VYEKKPRTTVDLKQNIKDEVAAISSTMLQRVMQNACGNVLTLKPSYRNYIQEVNIVFKMH
jgi:hypothetical protein